MLKGGVCALVLGTLVWFVSLCWLGLGPADAPEEMIPIPPPLGGHGVSEFTRAPTLRGNATSPTVMGMDMLP